MTHQPDRLLAFPLRPQLDGMVPATLRTRLGVLVSGSLAEGLAARLDGDVAIEDVRLGKFVKVAGNKYEFFCLVTDVQLDASNPDILRDPPSSSSSSDTFLRNVFLGTTTYGTVKIKPELMLASLEAPGALDEEDRVPRPARTIPPHFSPVSEATAHDFERVFGKEGRDFFQIGQPIDMDVPVCINLERLVQRSNGVFGKSGTGKSYLTRLLLCGVIREKKAVNLVFDMHSEYGWNGTNEDGHEVKGLAQLFPGQVSVFTLDMKSAHTRGVRPDGAIKIGLNEITVEDITLLQDELRLNPTAAESAVLCAERLGDAWVAELLDMTGERIAGLADETGAHVGSLAALRRKLKMLAQLSFVETFVHTSAVDQLVALLENGRNVILEFGQQRGLLSYILVANVITRRLHERWVRKTEHWLNTKQAADRPLQLMITIEEAHKFLNSEAARQTTFGTIARELRKFYVTLLVVDQRPSGIDSEVLSQIGTRITYQLNDDKDIDAIFTGVSGGSHLKTVLATLDSREQALLIGHAVPMPVLIRTRKYDQALYASLGASSTPGTPTNPGRRYEQVFPDN